MSEFLSLCQIPTGKRLNILLFGCSGVGKSCFLNSTWTDESKKPVRLVTEAKTREFDVSQQCTVAYHQYEIKENPNIRVFDTLGWNSGVNYVRKEFEMMLLGRVESGSPCKDLLPVEARDDRIIDIVCFVMDGLSGVKDEVIRAMKPFVEKAREMGKKVCVVITKMDEVIQFDSQNAIECRTLCTRGSVFRTFQKKIAPVLKVKHIFPMINYTYLDNVESELIMLLKIPIITFFTPLGNPPPEIEPLSLTKGEKTKSFQYPNEHPSSEYNTEFEDHVHSQDPRNVILSSQSFFQAIILGDRKYRLFVVKSFVCPERDIIGIIEDQGRTYFETTLLRNPKIDIMFDEILGPNHVPEYVFLCESGRPYPHLIPSQIEFLRLDLKVIPPILMKRKGFGMFQIMIENQNQMKKLLFSNLEQCDIIKTLRQKSLEMSDSLRKTQQKNNELYRMFVNERERTKNLIAKMEIDYENLKNEVKEMKDELEEEKRRIVEEEEQEEGKRKEERARINFPILTWDRNNVSQGVNFVSDHVIELGGMDIYHARSREEFDIETEINVYSVSRNSDDCCRTTGIAHVHSEYDFSKGSSFKNFRSYVIGGTACSSGLMRYYNVSGSIIFDKKCSTFGGENDSLIIITGQGTVSFFRKGVHFGSIGIDKSKGTRFFIYQSLGIASGVNCSSSYRQFTMDRNIDKEQVMKYIDILKEKGVLKFEE